MNEVSQFHTSHVHVLVPDKQIQVFAGSKFPLGSWRLQLCIQISRYDSCSQNVCVCDWLSLKKEGYLFGASFDRCFSLRIWNLCNARIKLTTVCVLDTLHPCLFLRNLVVFDLTKNQWDELKTAFSLQTGVQNTDVVTFCKILGLLAVVVCRQVLKFAPYEMVQDSPWLADGIHCSW